MALQQLMHAALQHLPPWRKPLERYFGLRLLYVIQTVLIQRASLIPANCQQALAGKKLR